MKKKLFSLVTGVGLLGLMASQSVHAFTVDTSICTEDLVNLCCSAPLGSDGPGTTGTTGTSGTPNSKDSDSDGPNAGKIDQGDSTAPGGTTSGGLTYTPNEWTFPSASTSSSIPTISLGGFKIPKSGEIKFPNLQVPKVGKKDGDSPGGRTKVSSVDTIVSISASVKERDSTNIAGGYYTTDSKHPNEECNGNGKNCEGSFLFTLYDKNNASLTSLSCDYNSSSSANDNLLCVSGLLDSSVFNSAHLKIESTGALSAQIYNITVHFIKTDLTIKTYPLHGVVDTKQEMACLYSKDSGVVPGETDVFVSKGSSYGGQNNKYISYTDEKWECEQNDRSDYTGIDRTYGYMKSLYYNLQ